MGISSKIREMLYINPTIFLSSYSGRAVKDFEVTIELTYRCTARCGFCERWKLNEKELSTEEVKSLIRGISRAGGKAISLSGGEPLLRRDLYEIISYAKGKKLKVTVDTNASLLKRNVRMLKEAGTDYINVSLDSSCPETHNQIRGVRIFDKVIEGISKTKEARMDIKTNTVITSKTIDGMIDVIKLSSSLGADSSFQPVHDDILNSLKVHQKDLKFIDLDEEKIAKEIDKMIGYKKVNGGLSWLDEIKYRVSSIFLSSPEKLLNVKCYPACRMMYFIDPLGNVYPCESRRDVLLGNIREKSFNSIIRSRKANIFRRNIIRNRNCVCWWNCLSPKMIKTHFLPLDEVLGFPLMYLWRRKIKRMERSWIRKQAL